MPTLRELSPVDVSARRARAAFVLVVAIVAGLLATAPGVAAASPAAEEAEFVSRINGLRVGLGLAPLAVDVELTAVGRSWAAGMAAAGRISHNPSYPHALPFAWEAGAENVGAGTSVEALFSAFVNSPGHRANLANPELTRVGVGVVHGADGRIYTSHQFLKVRGDHLAPSALVVTPAAATTAPAGFVEVSPARRVLDTRTGGPRPPAGTTFTLDLSGVPGVTAATTAVALTITSDAPAAEGFVSAWAAGSPRPTTSALNFAPGAIVAPRASWVLVPVSASRTVTLYISASTHLIVDVAAVTNTDAGAGYASIGATPVRAFDSRATAPFGAREARTLALTPFGVPANATLVAVNVTGLVDGVSGEIGYVSAAPNAADAPKTSTVNVAPGAPRANFALVPVGPGGTISLYSSVGAHVIVDIAGYIAPGASGRFVAVNPTRMADTRATNTTLNPGEQQRVALPFVGLPTTPSAVVGTLTVVERYASGWGAASDARPGQVSNVNFSAGGDAIAAGVMTPIPSGDATHVVASAPTHALLDVTGVIVNIG